MNCDTCHQLIGPNDPALRRAITDGIDDRGNPVVIGEWVWHRGCPPAGPRSAYDPEPDQ